MLEKLLLSKAEVSQSLGVPIATVLYLHRMGLLPACKVGRFLTWKPEAVREYAENLKPEV